MSMSGWKKPFTHWDIVDRTELQTGSCWWSVRFIRSQQPTCVIRLHGTFSDVDSLKQMEKKKETLKNILLLFNAKLFVRINIFCVFCLSAFSFRFPREAPCTGAVAGAGRTRLTGTLAVASFQTQLSNDHFHFSDSNVLMGFGGLKMISSLQMETRIDFLPI